MATSEIKVTTATLANKKDELAGYNKKLNAYIDELVQLESTLNGQWDGPSNDAFHKVFNTDITAFKAFKELVDKYVSNLEADITTYQKKEQANVNIANTRR